MITQVEMAMTKYELKKHIDWLVGTLPLFPPLWATKALGELIARHKELDAVEAAIEATKEKAAKVCKDYAEKCAEAENWEAEDVALHLDAAIRSMK